MLWFSSVHILCLLGLGLVEHTVVNGARFTALRCPQWQRLNAKRSKLRFKHLVFSSQRLNRLMLVPWNANTKICRLLKTCENAHDLKKVCFAYVRGEVHILGWAYLLTNEVSSCRLLSVKIKAKMASPIKQTTILCTSDALHEMSEVSPLPYRMCLVSLLCNDLVEL